MSFKDSLRQNYNINEVYFVQSYYPYDRDFHFFRGNPASILDFYS